MIVAFGSHRGAGETPALATINRLSYDTVELPCPATRTESGIHGTFDGRRSRAGDTDAARQPIWRAARTGAGDAMEADAQFGGEARDAGGPTGGDAARAGHHPRPGLSRRRATAPGGGAVVELCRTLCLRLLVLRSRKPVARTSLQDTSDSSWPPCSRRPGETVGDL